MLRFRSKKNLSGVQLQTATLPLSMTHLLTATEKLAKNSIVLSAKCTSAYDASSRGTKAKPVTNTSPLTILKSSMMHSTQSLRVRSLNSALSATFGSSGLTAATIWPAAAANHSATNVAAFTEVVSAIVFKGSDLPACLKLAGREFVPWLDRDASVRRLRKLACRNSKPSKLIKSWKSWAVPEPKPNPILKPWNTKSKLPEREAESWKWLLESKLSMSLDPQLELLQSCRSLK